MPTIHHGWNTMLTAIVSVRAMSKADLMVRMADSIVLSSIKPSTGVFVNTKMPFRYILFKINLFRLPNNTIRV